MVCGRGDLWGSALRGALFLMAFAAGSGMAWAAFGVPLKPTCPFIDPPDSSWLPWSSNDTWPSGEVPGLTPSAPESVTIPCGQAVLLDVPALNFGVLNVMGHLKFVDDPSLPAISINATAIIVYGQLTIGSADRPFSQRVDITLRTNGTREQFVTLPDTNGTRANVGEKVFAVVGGQVRLHGMPGGPSTPTWVHLSSTARVNDSSIHVDGDVSGWPLGGKLVIASTDYGMEQAETVTFTGIVPGPGEMSTVNFTPPLTYMHWGDDMDSGVPGVQLFQKAEVALLTRNIFIQGEREFGDRRRIGGHFIVFSTATPQFIDGVELAFMGQQGRLGRYPMHFHICRSHANSYVRRLTVRNSLQRCVVVHGTDDLTVEHNVAFNVTGHCFMTEDGIEVNNTFSHNFGAVAYKASVLIPPEGKDPGNTDNIPSLFWMSNANNTLVNNAAGGSEGAGFWYQLELGVRGISKNLPGAADITPKYIPIKSFEANTAHSCSQGVSTYERGFMPHTITHPAPGVDLYAPVSTWLVRVNAHKNYYGVFLHDTDWVGVRSSTFSDNGFALDLTGFALQVVDTVVVADSENVGNPSSCYAAASSPNCLPLDTCTLPVTPPADGTFRARSVLSPGQVGPRRVGVLLKENTNPLPPYYRSPVLVSGVTFVGFSPRCGIDYSAFGTTFPAHSFDTGHAVRNITFVNCTRPVFFDPVETWNATTQKGFSTYNDAGWGLLIRDLDGSIIGASPADTAAMGLTATAMDNPGLTLKATNRSAPGPWGVGFVAANSSLLLPLKNGTRGLCLGEESWNAFRCWGVCYRTLRVMYPEPGFNGKDTSSRSSLVVTRVADGSNLTLQGTDVNAFGNMMVRPGPPSDFLRAFSVNLIVGPEYTYSLQKVGGPNPGADPSWFYFGFEDDSANCGLSSKVRLLTKSTSRVYWSESSSGFPFYESCEHPTDDNARTFVRTYCTAGNNSIFEANLGTPGPLNDMPMISATLQATKPGACTQNATCGLIATGDTWQYLDRPLPSPFPTGLSMLDAPMGRTPFASGYLQVNGVHYKVLPHDDLPNPTVTSFQPQTMYFWTSFKVTNASCFRNITMGVKAKDGYAIFINGAAAFVQGLSSNGTGLPFNTQGAYVQQPYWDQFSIPLSVGPPTAKSPVRLVNGENIVAVEVHQSAPGTPYDQICFDFWLAAAYSCA